MDDPGFDLQPEDLRRLGHAVVDAVADRMAALRDRPVATRVTRAALEARVPPGFPEAPGDPDGVLATVVQELLAPGLNVDHPRFFGYVPPPSDLLGVWADALAAGFDAYAGTWQASPGSALVELQVLDWLRALCELPPQAAGVLLTGGSMANFTALAVALQERGPAERARAVVYASSQVHSSVQRAARVLGVRHAEIAVDDRGRIVVADLDAAVAADRAAGRVPWCLVANAGATSTGAVDPLADLRDRADAAGLWLHVDAAFGAAAALTPAGRAALAGLGEADSVTVDPHKWLFQPPELGCLLVRDGPALARAFAVAPPYMRDAAVQESAEVNFADRSLELTRGARGLKLWMALHVKGVGAFRRAVAHGLELAGHAERRLAAMDGWEVVTPAQMAVVTFRPAGAADGAVRALAGAMEADGFAFLSTTEVAGRTVLRLCTINPRTTSADVDATLERLDRRRRGA